jgi:hypothetical protein
MNKRDVLIELTQLIDGFDKVGSLSKEMSLFSVAIGTLRKDRSIAEDIIQITATPNGGLGATALTRILIEDYLHLLFLEDNRPNLTKHLEDFNLHPHIDHYVSVQAMKAWGFKFEKDDEATLVKIEDAFEKNKARFLRRKQAKDPFDPEDYYRTWTKLGLLDLIARTSLPKDAATAKSLHYINETYNHGSTIIHHNAFIIWLLANQGSNFFSQGFPGVALDVSLITLSRTYNLCIKIAGEEAGDVNKYAIEMTQLADVMEKIPESA